MTGINNEVSVAKLKYLIYTKELTNTTSPDAQPLGPAAAAGGHPPFSFLTTTAVVVPVSAIVNPAALVLLQRTARDRPHPVTLQARHVLPLCLLQGGPRSGGLRPPAAVTAAQAPHMLPPVASAATAAASHCIPLSITLLLVFFAAGVIGLAANAASVWPPPEEAALPNATPAGRDKGGLRHRTGIITTP